MRLRKRIEDSYRWNDLSAEKNMFSIIAENMLQGKSWNDVEDVRDRDTWVTKEGKTRTPITGYSRC